MHTPLVKIIAHSVSRLGIPIVTFQLRYWRAIHAELMTHRVFSRNAGSSRARPVATFLGDCMSDPWGPSHWGKNQPGMQADVEHDAMVIFPKFMEGALREFNDTPESVECNFEYTPQQAWHFTSWVSAISAKAFSEAGYHKQIVNRILEPYTYIDVVLTSTDFNNWFALRDHPAAQPEIKELAHLMREALEASEPKKLELGQWHLPYIDQSDWALVKEYFNKIGVKPSVDDYLIILKKMSTARCARVSYKLFDGNTPSVEKDLALYEDLIVSQPVHASPCEHQATPDYYKNLAAEWANPNLHGNFRGWIQYRKTIPYEYIPG